MRERIRRIVEDTDTPGGRAFDWFVQGLIVLSLVTFSIETMPDLSEEARRWLGVIERVTVGLFTAEYLLRLWVAERRSAFVFSFYGLIDLAAILPFYIAGGVDLRSVRILRLLRLLRMLKLFRYSRALERSRLVFARIRAELVLVLAASLALVYLAAVGIYYFESEAQPEVFGSVFSSMWWAVATLTTVGYGDVYPITAGGRVFTSVLLFIGLGIIAIPSGLIASALTDVLREESDAAE